MNLVRFFYAEKMAKLGYTWYPKDWNNSEAVFELTLQQRGLYRELIDLAMLNDNKTVVKPSVWSRRWAVSLDSLKLILQVLESLELIKITDNNLFIPSCEPRLKLVRGGRKGGQNKPTTKPTVKPIVKPTVKPTVKQKKDKRKEKEKEIGDVLSTLNLDKVEAFKLWKKYRDDIKKPIKTTHAYKLIVNKLNLEPIDKVNYVINNSIENGWQGLFWDKYDEKAHKPKRDVVKVDPDKFWNR